MKRIIAIVLAFVVIMGLAGCSMSTPTENEPVVVDTSATVATEENLPPSGNIESDNPGKPTNYMDEIKAEIHDELFREETEDTLDIVDRIFKHMSIETVKSFIDGDDASVLMNITTINAGKAWITGMERYAIACAENLFAENYDDDATLYSYYLEEFESCVRKADYITISVEVEMDYRNHRWEWGLDDDVINAITGYLLAAIEGDINSLTVELFEAALKEVESESSEIPEPAENLPEDITIGMKNAAKEAASYLEWTSFSREGLAKQLRYEGYLEEEIEYALKSVGY